MRPFYLICLAIFAVLLAVDPALAATAEEIPTWRVWWDHIWRILNFLILAFFLVKMAKEPLKNFLAGQREKVARDFEKMEKAKEQAIAERQELEAKIENLADELARYEEQLAELPRPRSARTIMADTRREADLIMDRAQLWSEQALRKARQQAGRGDPGVGRRLGRGKDARGDHR